MVWLWKEDSQGSWGLHDYDPATMRWTLRADMRRRLARVRPEAVAGLPTRYGYDRAARRFTLEYTGSAAVTAPTRVYVPSAEDFAATYAVTCDGRTVTVTRDMATGVVEVPCAGVGAHTVTVTAQ